MTDSRVSTDRVRTLHIVSGPHRGQLVETAAEHIKIRGYTYKWRYAVYDRDSIGDYYFFTFRGWEDELRSKYRPEVIEVEPKKLAP